MMFCVGNFRAIDIKKGAAGIRIEKNFIPFDNVPVHFVQFQERFIKTTFRNNPSYYLIAFSIFQPRG
jgi:hypothetical protein